VLRFTAGENMIYVVGSGPAGVSSAVALVEQGHRVVMLDAGLELESDRAEIVRRLEDQDSDLWDEGELEILRDNMEAGTSGIPLKYVYGSDFPYRETAKFIPRAIKNVAIVPSLAKGGFSNVWGAAVLPYLADDITNWPISVDELAPHYRSVLNFMSLAAKHDDLASRFPLYSDNYQLLPQSLQIEGFLSDLRKHRKELQSQGFLFGYSRLAVATRNRHNRGCVTCGLCMYGCPYGLIYNTASTLDELRTHSNFTYVKDVVVQRVSEANGKVKIVAQSRSDAQPLFFEASRVYIAAGVLSTTKVLLDSMGAYDRELTLKDSQYFLLPLLRYRGVAGASEERLHTLSQVFIEVFDRELSEKSVHLQVYSYNDLYRQALATLFGVSYPLFRPAANAFLNRFLLIQGYLHSDISPTISVRLEAPTDGRPSRLVLEGTENSATKKALRKLSGKLAKSRSLFKAVPLYPMMRIGEPGRGFHSGGVFPMRDKPGDLETDALGRPSGFERVHLCDASTFPSIPASTITLTVMANAHRLAAAST
jgi:choline dehydrogenase-like flavoprotein